VRPAANVVGGVDAVAREAPERVALIAADTRLTYRQLARRAGGFARWLEGRGIRAGGRVALVLPNGVAFAIALYGALRRGVTVAPLNPQLTAEERARILADFSPDAVIDSPRIVMDAAVGAQNAADGAEIAADGADAMAHAGAPALVLYTSGTTGRPKGAVLSHAAVRAGNASWMGPVMALRSADRVLAVLPLSHSYGINGALLAPLLAGATVVILERFAPEAVIAAIREHRVTVFPGVATMFQRILDAGCFTRDDFAPVRLALSGAAPCPWPLADAWRQRTGVRILRGYGMTELHRPLSYLADDPRDFPECVGCPVPGVELRLVDDSGADVPRGEVGELLIRTDAAMDGYLSQPEETEAAMKDGWFRTGDLARLSDEGFVSIVGRKKELILRGGYSVYPPEVEAALLAHPAVAEAAVVGVPDTELGEEIVAFVRPRPGLAVTPGDLVAWCQARVAGYKCPRAVSLVADFPRSATGKILKPALAQLAATPARS
jgi:long-chain acyl-CoA synthetase